MTKEERELKNGLISVLLHEPVPRSSRYVTSDTPFAMYNMHVAARMSLRK